MTAILFDLDGTLVDTPAVILQSMRTMADRWGVEVSDDQAKPLIGTSLEAIVDSLLPRLETNERAVAASTFRSAFAKLTLPDSSQLVFDQIPETLQALHRAGHQTAIVTSKVTISARELLDATGLAHYFGTVIGHDLASHGKPAPDLALLAAERLDVAPEYCTVVGDAVGDILMAKAAGMRSVGVLWGVAGREDLERAQADAILAAPEELASALLRQPNSER